MSEQGAYGYPVILGEDWLEEIKDWPNAVVIKDTATGVIYSFFDQPERWEYWRNSGCDCYRILAVLDERLPCNAGQDNRLVLLGVYSRGREIICNEE